MPHTGGELLPLICGGGSVRRSIRIRLVIGYGGIIMISNKVHRKPIYLIIGNGVLKAVPHLASGERVEEID